MSTTIHARQRTAARRGVIRSLVVLHRWVGIVLCLFFAMWFASGVVMIYVPYPALPDHARVSGMETIDAALVRVAPAEALAASGTANPVRLRLLQAAGQARYVITPATGSMVSVSATDRSVLAPVGPEEARRIAASFGGAPVHDVAGPYGYDQWTVHNRFDAARPFYRADLADAAGTSLYVSTRSGEVLQRTTRFERAWNYPGSVVHWLYPTLLRRNWLVWNWSVWALALIGVVVTVAGLWLGVLRWRAQIRSGRGGISPYRRWLKWHHVGGLVIGGFILTWIFSGWVSMDHGLLFSRGMMSQSQATAYAGLAPPQAAGAVSLEQVDAALPATEMEIVALAGASYLLARDRDGTRVTTPSGGPAESALPTAAILAATQAAFPGIDVSRPISIPQDDVYARVRSSDGVGGHGLRMVLQDQAASWVYVNPESGRVIEVMDRSRRLYRWLFFGLHTLDFPFLASDWVWTPVILGLLGLGFAFSVTSIVIGWRRLHRKLLVLRS